MAVSHKNIKRFHIDGEIYDEAQIPRIKEQYIDLLKLLMQGKGYVIRYDIDPDFTVEYNGRSFKFILSVYGVYIGKRKAECFQGIDKNTLIVKPTQKNKSEESWNRAESA